LASMSWHILKRLISVDFTLENRVLWAWSESFGPACGKPKPGPLGQDSLLIKRAKFVLSGLKQFDPRKLTAAIRKGNRFHRAH